MAYPALPDRRMPYHRDGTVVAYGAAVSTSTAFAIAQGITGYLSSGDRIELNDGDYAALSVQLNVSTVNFSAQGFRGVWFFFPEQREVTGAYYGCASPGTYSGSGGITSLEGSNDTTNGVDGTWETASWPGGQAFGDQPSLDGWRRNIKAVSFTGGKRTIRIGLAAGGFMGELRAVHLYGEKYAGQTPDDLIFIDHDTTPGVEYQAPEDFGDRPLGTTVVRQFRVKNASATKTANAINLQCNDSDFAISTDGVTWVTTINISSLAAGAESATLYVRCTTPAPGNILGPRFAEIVAIVGSWA